MPANTTNDESTYINRHPTQRALDAVLDGGVEHFAGAWLQVFSAPKHCPRPSHRSVRRWQRARARHADRRSLDRTQVGKDLVRVGQGSPVTAQDRMRRIIGVDRPIGPVDRGQREARVVRGRPVIAALDEVLQVSKPLPLRSGSRGIQICSGVGRAEFSEPDRRRGDR